MQDITEIVLSNAEYDALDSHLFDTLDLTMHGLVSLGYYGGRMQYSFHHINTYDQSFISIDDTHRIIYVYLATRGLGTLETRTGIHCVPRYQLIKFCRSNA